MLIFWQFTVRILFILAIISLPAIHFFTGSALAGNLANFVLVLLTVLFFVGIGGTMSESKKASNGELTGEKLDRFLKAHKAREGVEKNLFSLSRAAWVVGLFVMAACGYEWFAGVILTLWLLYTASASVARDSAAVVRSQTTQAA